MSSNISIKDKVTFSIITILFLSSAHCYYISQLFDTAIATLLLSIPLLFLSGSIRRARCNKVVIILLIYFTYIALRNIAIGSYLSILPILSVVFLGEKQKTDCLSFVSKVLALLVGASLISWCLYLVGYISPIGHEEFYGYSFVRSPLFLVSESSDSNWGLMMIRFQGLFCEPGHIGMLCALLLYANDYRIKEWYNVVLLICLLFTISLAAYVLLIIGFCFHLYSENRKNSIITILIVIALTLIAFLYISNNEDSQLYQLLIKKIVEDDNGGRYGDYFVQYYNHYMSSFEHFLFGMGQNFNVNDFPGNSGYKIELISNGFVGVLLLFCSYLTICVSNYSLKGFLFLILFVISFIQRPYATWYAEWFTYILALPSLKYSSNGSI